MGLRKGRTSWDFGPALACGTVPWSEHFPPRRFFEQPDVERWFPWGVFAPFAEDSLRVEEIQAPGEVVIRVEIPGVDPEKDVDIRVVDGALHIRAEKHKETQEELGDITVSEIHYGALSRVLPLPPGASEDTVRADYRNGVLAVHIPVTHEPPAKGTKIPVTQG